MALPPVGVSVDDFDAHAPSGAGDHPDRGILGGGMEIVLFGFDDLENLFSGDLADFFLVGGLGPGGDAGRFFEQGGGGRRLGDECKRPVLSKP